MIDAVVQDVQPGPIGTARIEDYQWAVDRLQKACPRDTVTAWRTDYDNSLAIVFRHQTEHAQLRYAFWAKNPDFAIDINKHHARWRGRLIEDVLAAWSELKKQKGAV